MIAISIFIYLFDLIYMYAILFSFWFLYFFTLFTLCYYVTDIFLLNQNVLVANSLKDSKCFSQQREEFLCLVWISTITDNKWTLCYAP